MAHKGFQLGLEMPALLGGIATLSFYQICRAFVLNLEMPALLGGIATSLTKIITNSLPTLEMPALLGGIATMSCLSYELMP